MIARNPTFLLRFHIGPVQDFIAQARSTRDLWSGSYLLSWLVAKGIKALPKDADLVFPCRDGQPLLDEPLKPGAEGMLIPNLPNIFIASVHDAAKQVGKALCATWKVVAETVWNHCGKIGLGACPSRGFFAQGKRHLHISWQLPNSMEATPLFISITAGTSLTGNVNHDLPY